MRHYIGYTRVSTQEQGESGLGLEAQQSAIAQHVAAASGKLNESYMDVQSGMTDSLKSRPGLRCAIAHARRTGATLIVAKQDRLARSVLVLAQIMATSKLKVLSLDNPHDDETVTYIYGAIAQREGRLISERTKAALAAAKARGVKLGGYMHRTEDSMRAAITKANAARREQALAAYSEVFPLISQQRSLGASYHAIAKRLNECGYTARRGGAWTPSQVRAALLAYAPAI